MLRIYRHRVRAKRCFAPIVGLLVCALGALPSLAVTIVQLGTAPTVDGTVSAAEYGLGSALATQDADDSFGSGNNLGNLYVAWSGTTLYFGLQNATLETNNGIAFFLSSPNLSNGTSNPASFTDQGETGDSGTPNHAESLLTRAENSNSWTFPHDIHFGFGLVDTGSNVSQTGVPSTRDNAGLYRFDTNNIDDLGFAASDVNFTDGNGLEFTVDLAQLSIALGDTIQVQGFIASNSGFTSNESLPGGSLNGTQPGSGSVTFGDSLDITLGEEAPVVPEPGTVSLFLLGGILLRRKLRL